MDRAEQPVRVAQAFLEQVGQPFRAVGQELERVLGIVVLRQDDDPEVGVLGTQLVGKVDALGREGRGHADVEEHDVGAVLRPERAKAVGVPGGAGDRQAADLFEDRPRALAHQVVVVADQHARRPGARWVRGLL